MTIQDHNRQLVKDYFLLRRHLYEALNYTSVRKIKGPCRLLALVWKEDKTYDFQYFDLSPFDTYEGQFIAWNIGIYD